MAGDEGGHSLQQEQLKQRQEGHTWFQGRVSRGPGAAGIRSDRREPDWGGGSAYAREGSEYWAKEQGLCQGGQGGGLKPKG